MWRRSAPRVVGGRVQRQHRTAETPYFGAELLPLPAVTRLRPARAHRHVAEADDVQRFVRLIPRWAEISRELRAIVLSPRLDCMGFYRDGVVSLCAWPRELETRWDEAFWREHAAVLERLDVPVVHDGDEVVCGFDAASARGFMLMHVLLHELGHHHDRMASRRRRFASRGEPYAEAYAHRRADELWDAYFREFGG